MNGYNAQKVGPKKDLSVYFFSIGAYYDGSWTEMPQLL